MVTRRTGKRFATGVCVLASTLGFCLIAAPAMAQTPIFSVQSWTVQPAFAAEARNNISGATCAEAPSRACLAVNNATVFAQLFSTSGTTLRTGPIVGITSDVSAVANPPHAEGAAHDARFFYIVTSRAKDLTGGQVDTSFLVIRFFLDSTGRPPAPGGVTGLQISEKIRDALTAGIAIPQIPGQQLIRTTADISGIAVKDDVIHLGFQAPVLSGKSFIVSVPVQVLFGSEALNLMVRPIALGTNQSVHDLATVSDGLLILTGPTRELAGPGALFHFNDSTGQLTPVAELVDPVNRKGDGLLLLQEDPEFYRFLVLFDGTPDGGPIEYSAPR